MKPTQSRLWTLAGLVLLSALILVGCAKATLPVDVTLQLPIDFLFKDQQGASKTNLLGMDIVYLGSAAQGSVYDGARQENASLVVVRWNGQDHFYSLKGLLVSNLQQVVCRVECDIQVALVEGADILVDIRSLDLTRVLSAPRVVWQNPAQTQPTPNAPAPTTPAAGATLAPTATGASPSPVPTGGFECKYLLFKQGTRAVTLVPLKLRSTPVLPENFNSNVISYLQAGEKVEVLSDSPGEWVNLKKSSGEIGYSKQCTTLNGRFLQPGE